MIDLGSVIYSPMSTYILGYSFRTELLSALSEAVDYDLKGTGRSSARGISFCDAVGFTAEELEIYSKNCPSPYYLALLDAISSWNAPDDLYTRENIDRLTPIDQKEEYRINITKIIKDGLPALEDKGKMNIAYYYLYQLDQETGQLLCLGKSMCRPYTDSEDNNVTWVANDPMTWITLEDEFCGFELIFSSDDTMVYNIPVALGGKMWYLRCGRGFENNLIKQMMYYGEIIDNGTYTVYGIWEGYDSDSRMPGRNVLPLSQKAGQEYRVVLPIIGEDGLPDGDYQWSEPKQVYRNMEVKETPLPAGTYYLQYETEDAFGRKILLDKIKIFWDGEKIGYPEDFSWEGDLVLKRMH